MTPTAFAFFDFDDTLCPGDSILPYLLYCIRQGAAPRRQLLLAAVGFLKWKLNPAHASASKETSLSFIRGRNVAEMDDLARDFFREQLLPRCYREGLAEIEQLRARGVKVLVVSASPDVYMRVLPEFLPVDGVMATTCETADGCYTGHVGANCKGDEKPRRIAAWLQQHHLSIDRAASSGYGDSPSDADMLLLTAHPNLINPKRKLLQRVPEGRVLRWR